MYVINFKLFANKLHFDCTGGDFCPLNSPVLIIFSLPNDHSRHSMLKELSKILEANQIGWISPYKKMNEEWVVDLNLLRSNFDFLQKEEYLKDTITVEPEFHQIEKEDENTGEMFVKESKIKFKIDPSEINIYSILNKAGHLSELDESLSRFKKDHPANQRCAFLMTKFEDSPFQVNIINKLKNVFSKNGLKLLRADEKHYSDDLLTNIRTYMHGCSFGVALFERINSDYFNPNVSLEIGYMMALEKPILFLKDKSLKSLPTDLIGKLYVEFDIQSYNKTIEKSVVKWLEDCDIL